MCAGIGETFDFVSGLTNRVGTGSYGHLIFTFAVIMAGLKSDIRTFSFG